ncbi:MFS transporter [Chloroflexia bacterium SDU3-3]|nr:MFS transporter [Chloroflexia bacterium SDU3-3]
MPRSLTSGQVSIIFKEVDICPFHYLTRKLYYVNGSIPRMNQPELSMRAKILGMAGLALVLFLVSLDQTVVGTAMPRIIADLNGFELYAWVTTAYLLTETAVIPIVGKLGDIYGRKWITIAGVAGFLISSALCGMASSMEWLVVCRGIQGISGGAIFGTVFTLTADIFPNLKDRARYQGILFAVFSLSSVVGPVVGGWLTDALNWRWVFYINLPLGILAMFVLPIVLPQSHRQPNAKIDYWGALTITVAVVALLTALETAGAGESWGSPLVLGGLIVALAAFAIFVPIERRAAEPIIPFDLFRNRTITSSTIVQFMMGIVMFGVALYAPLFVQGIMGLSASASGMVMMPMAITMPISGIITGQLVARIGRVKPLLLVGVALMTVALVLMTTLTIASSPITISIYMFVLSLGMGMIMPLTTLSVQASVSPQSMGVATSATQFIRSIGATVGTALIGTLVTNGYRANLASHAAQGTPSEALTALHAPNALINQQKLQELTQIMSGLPNGAQLTQALLGTARQVLADAIRSGFLLALGAGLLAVLGALLMTNLHLDDAHRSPGPGAEHAPTPLAAAD